MKQECISKPQLFKEIEEHDRLKPDTSSGVISIEEVQAYHVWHKRKLELIRAAEKFISEQKLPGGVKS